MRDYNSELSIKAGMDPGTLIHVGDKKVKQPKLTLIEYDEKYLEVHVNPVIDIIKNLKVAEDRKIWINVDGLHQTELIESLGQVFGVHPLVLEDILDTTQRPKTESYDDYIYITIRTMFYERLENAVDSDQISIILGNNFILSFQEMETDLFKKIRQRMERPAGNIRKKGVDYLTYSLIDSIVDNYYLLLEDIGEEIERLEDELIKEPAPATLQSIHELKREMIILRRSLWPLREIIASLQRDESGLIRESTGIYLRDLYDHSIQVIETVETYREMLSGMLDLYISTVSNRMNEVMKVLTIIATIFIPLTFIAGIYGMNFEYMPELKWEWGYPAVMIFMATISVIMLYYFKKKTWL
ncbi:magnesium/cobalt transporter CorA [Methanohalophilus portucalensis]|uniref:Magnesium transport protein CorA n=3 Tax=Methanohalophilus portucalensis TaxID=39664 RepID=A0A1X7NTI9_9EURY|nr:magnesium/cobalt transporter CorA [Methanohalophilus portucalensis]RNI11442.1 magnesium/cobalt transporter CorA [Methanohalophilus portucalensis FDF-1]SMH40733.1 magnesium transporter [Methanohalophilus portucalensis FDF-1]